MVYHHKSAELSECGAYRYELVRLWERGRVVTWCMLNPSTADSSVDDPTIRKCVGFAKRWGYGGIRVVNLFALRATDPAALTRHVDPIGPRNERILRDLSGDVVAAWGSRVPKEPWARRVVSVARERSTWCLGTTRNGEPRHPLMLSYSTQLEGFAVTTLTDALRALLPSSLFTNDEAELSRLVNDALRNTAASYEAEYALDRNNRVDFYSDGTIIELKVHGSWVDAYRQLDRYLSFERAKRALLVTTRVQHCRIPRRASNGKPIEVLCLGGGGL